MRGEPIRGGLPDPGFFSLPGLEQAQAIRRGLVPRAPLSHLTGLSLTHVSPGSVAATIPTSPWLQTNDGTLDFMIVSEVALSMAVLTGAPPGADLHLAAMSVIPFRPWTVESDRAIARARVVSTARTFTFAEASVEDDTGRLIAHVAGTAVVEPIDPPPPPYRPGTTGPAAAPRYPSVDPYLRPLPANLGTIPRQDQEQLPGLEIVQRVHDGRLPKSAASALIDMQLDEVDSGRIVFTLPADEWLCYRRRSIAPGVLIMAFRWALMNCVLTLSPGGQRIGIIAANGTILRDPVPDGRALRLETRVTEKHGDLVLASGAIAAGDERIMLGQLTARLQPLHQPPTRPARPVLATVVFTDLVDSTAHARRVGDQRWGELLGDHDAVVRRHLAAFRGREIKTTGDGFLATFDSPADAVDFARASRREVRALGLEARLAVHTGQCELVDGDVIGIAVHLASRVLGFAGPGEVLVTGTVRELLLGTGVDFDDRGRHELKGLDGTWPLYALADQ